MHVPPTGARGGRGVPQWCLTAPCVAAPVGNTRLFDVGAEPYAAENVDDVRNLDVVAVDDPEPVV
jgi:hypothetical protein